jgi:hypothetical protein
MDLVAIQTLDHAADRKAVEDLGVVEVVGWCTLGWVVVVEVVADGTTMQTLW